MLAGEKLQYNIEGLFTDHKRRKIALLREQAIDRGIGIIALVGSHLLEEIRDAAINMIGFHTIRADRLEGIRKSGVIVYLRIDIECCLWGVMVQ